MEGRYLITVLVLLTMSLPFCVSDPQQFKEMFLEILLEINVFLCLIKME